MKRSPPYFQTDVFKRNVKIKSLNSNILVFFLLYAMNKNGKQLQLHKQLTTTTKYSLLRPTHSYSFISHVSNASQLPFVNCAMTKRSTTRHTPFFYKYHYIQHSVHLSTKWIPAWWIAFCSALLGIGTPPILLRSLGHKFSTPSSPHMPRYKSTLLFRLVWHQK